VALEESPLGPVLSESPAAGTPLMDVVARLETPPDPDAFVRVLETGLDWIGRLQRTHTGPRVTVSPGTVHRELTPDELDVTPPAVSEPVEYPRVPAHGDYHPGNVLVADDGTIERVIDWEYSALDRNPVADPGFFTLKLAEFAFGGFEAGVRATLLEDTPHADCVYEQLLAYCDAIGVRPRTFGAYLGHALVTQTDVHFQSDSPWRFHANPREKCDRLTFLYKNLEEIRCRLDRQQMEYSVDSQPLGDSSSDADTAGSGRHESVRAADASPSSHVTGEPRATGPFDRRIGSDGTAIDCNGERRRDSVSGAVRAWWRYWIEYPAARVSRSTMNNAVSIR